jgi:hypothetical protein
LLVHHLFGIIADFFPLYLSLFQEKQFLFGLDRPDLCRKMGFFIGHRWRTMEDEERQLYVRLEEVAERKVRGEMRSASVASIRLEQASYLGCGGGFASWSGSGGNGGNGEDRRVARNLFGLSVNVLGSSDGSGLDDSDESSGECTTTTSSTVTTTSTACCAVFLDQEASGQISNLMCSVDV